MGIQYHKFSSGPVHDQNVLRLNTCSTLQGLQDCIGLSVVHPTWKQTRPGKDMHSGWTFAAPDDPPFQNANGE